MFASLLEELPYQCSIPCREQIGVRLEREMKEARTDVGFWKETARRDVPCLAVSESLLDKYTDAAELLGSRLGYKSLGRLFLQHQS